MFFRERGKRVQCIRSYYDKVKKHGGQLIVLSFPNSTDDIKGIDPVLRKRLTKDELDQLKTYLSEDRKTVENLIEHLDTCSIALMKRSFDKAADIKGLKRASNNLNKTISKVGL